MYINYATRKENVLCLAYNTIKLNDLPLYDIILEVAELSYNPKQCLYHVLNRKDHVLGVQFGINEETFNSLKMTTYVDNYKNAPYTGMFDVVEKIRTSQFAGELYILFNTFDGKIDVSELEEPKYKKLTYGGHIEEIEEIIKKYGITAIVADDVELVHQIIKRNKVDGMSFFISKFGYNFNKVDDNTYKMKYDELINIMHDEKKFEFTFVDLWKFTHDDMEEIACNG